MKFKSFLNKIIKLSGAVSLASLGLSLLVQPSQAESDKFICGELNGEPATYMVTSTQNVPLVVWRTHIFGSEWTPQKRCEHVKEKLQAAYEANEHELTIGRKKDLDILCSANKAGGECQRQIMTLPKGLDPNEAVDILQHSMVGASSAVLLNNPGIRSNIVSSTDGWNGEKRPYLNLQQIRRAWDNPEKNWDDFSEIKWDNFGGVNWYNFGWIVVE